MKRTLRPVAGTVVLVASLACFLGAAGCTGQVGPTDPPEAPAAREAEALSAGPAFPPRVEAPIGATAAQVCAREDGDMKKALSDYAAANGKTLTRASGDVSTWPREDGVPTCRFCDLDGAFIRTPNQGSGKAALVDSSAAGATFQAGGAWTMRNVYARGLQVDGWTLGLDLENVDFRCGKLSAITNITKAINADWSGSSHLFGLAFMGPVRDVRLTGATAELVDFEPGVSVTDLRLDGMRDSRVAFAGFTRRGVPDVVTVHGSTRLDGSTGIVLALKGTTFAGGRITTTGARGSFDVDRSETGAPTFSGVDLSDAGDSFAFHGAVRFTDGTRLPVGKAHFFADAELPKVDLSSVHLVTKTGEAWPAAPLDLSGLKLTHGALPDGANLSIVTLDDASLERVDLTKVTLSKNGRHASFRGAHLAQAELRRQKIDGVDLTRADLRGANLALVSGSARFDQARAGILGAHVDDNDTDQPKVTSFERAELGTSSFQQTYLEYADFDFAGLADVHFDLAHLDWATFTGARLQKGGIPNTTLKSAASVLATRWDGADLRGVDLSRLDFSSAEHARASFASSYLCGVKLAGTKLHDANLVGAFFDVEGDVQFPDGTKGACAGGDRSSSETSPRELGTVCPDGSKLTQKDAACTDAQWRVPGIPRNECTDEEKRSPLDDGGPCTKACQCQSLYCAPNGTCQDAP